MQKKCIRTLIVAGAVAALPVAAHAQIAQVNWDAYGDGTPIPGSPAGVPFIGGQYLDNGGPSLQVDSETHLAACIRTSSAGHSKGNIVSGARGTFVATGAATYDAAGIVCDDTKRLRLRIRANDVSFVGFYLVGNKPGGNPGGWRVRAFPFGALDVDAPPAPLIDKTVSMGRTRNTLWVSVADETLAIGHVLIEPLPGPNGEPLVGFGIDDVYFSE
jgi:hypothetical protein